MAVSAAHHLGSELRRDPKTGAPDFTFHTKQLELIQDSHPIKVAVCGRRSGKSDVGVKWSLLGGMDDWRHGRGGVSWVVMPTYPMMRPIWRKFMALTPPEWVVDIKGTEAAPDFIKLGLPGVKHLPPHTIEFKTASNPERLVSEGLRRLWGDECGLIKERAWVESLQPALIDYDAPALLTGTPKGRNWFHGIFKQGCQPSHEVASFHWTSFDNPYLKPRAIARLSRTMPRLMRLQEILARFLDAEGLVFGNVRRLVQTYEPGEVVVWGVDLAKQHDYTVLVGLDEQGRLAGFHRFNREPWPILRKRIETYVGDTPAQMDATGLGGPVVDEMLSAGFNVKPFLFTHASKSRIVHQLQMGCEDGSLTLWDEPDLINELEAYEYDESRTGLVTFNAPENGFDDCVMALAMAWDLWLRGGDHGVTILTDKEREARQTGKAA